MTASRLKAVAVIACVLIAAIVCSMPSNGGLDGEADVAVVKRVVDGDTLEVFIGDRDETIRLIGIDTPESVHPDDRLNCEEGELASAHTSELVSEGKVVYLSRDISESDRYGRLLRYVWFEKPSVNPSNEEASEQMLNAILVRQGYAQAKAYPPDTKWHTLFEQLANEALGEDAGVSRMWGEPQ